MNTTRSFEDARTVVEFFNCNLKQVNYFLLRIVVNLNYRPDWLRRRKSLNELPRWEEVSDTKKTFVSAQTNNQTEICERIVWVVENLQSPWVLNSEGFGFTDPNEALHFKLRWA